MPLDLPNSIAGYFAAENGRERDAIAQWFAADAVVRDEGGTHQGLDSIKTWMAQTKTNYQHTVEPLCSAQKDGKTVVTVRLAGNFPGSPVEVEFAFGLEEGKIRSLEIG